MIFHPFLFLTQPVSSIIKKIQAQKNFDDIENFEKSIIPFIPKNKILQVKTEINILLENYHKLDIKYITYFDEDYPKLLKEIYDPPIVLFYQGNIKLLNSNCVSVVGTRKPSSISIVACKYLAEEIYKNQEFDTIVSGIAIGIDRAIMEESLNLNLGVVGVMATGFDKFYPSENLDIYQRMQKDNQSLLISENLTSEKTQKYSFPKRNRIITALSQNAIIMEAPKKSGAISSANSALQQNRNIFIFDHPFQIHNDGGKELLNEGAQTINLNLMQLKSKIKHYSDFVADYENFSEHFFEFSKNRFEGNIDFISNGYFNLNQ